ncbi:hypothetical protein ACFXJ5_08945 [Streptomyces sp. NPDC059373]
MIFVPDVAFGIHPDLGVVAALATDHPYAEQVLRQHYFRHRPDFALYALPHDAPYNRVLQVVAGATRLLQQSGLLVMADPRIMLAPPIPQSPGAPVREAVPAQSLTALACELHTVTRSAEAAEVLRELLDERFGAMSELEHLVDTAATWCERLDTIEGRELGTRLRTIASHVGFLSDRIADVEADLQDIAGVIPADAPPLSATPARTHENRPASYGTRAQAAVATSSHLPIPIPTGASPEPRPTPPLPRPTRTR